MGPSIVQKRAFAPNKIDVKAMKAQFKVYFKSKDWFWQLVKDDMTDA